ncbi:hypothetical protein [Tenacibaculum singaporense]|uniref:Uncharacterized protein n=1 Tax=Tenacibaculum singaporense TaxID=2358479 RepID=A0A3Q8RRR2_9FLAO|nr:hypothetical protein [Tenacibaculum singaporense]AZJ36503.1 hypothetical protein D6T69_13610 [Tenacibaculum singaporense]
MEFRNSKDALFFFLREKKKSIFLSNELGIIMIMLSCLLWLLSFHFSYQFLFFTIAIQISFLCIGFKMISTEKYRQLEAINMIKKINIKNKDREIYFNKMFEKLLREYSSKEKHFEENPKKQIEIILKKLNSLKLNRTEKTELINMLNYFLYKHYVG